mmetsp:Transcript_80051/g.193946  ORF Transcript_80051/g.193946 Transcript_80051/m.193946 type:complete len:219 (-) Transcript_80051:543-1199(-)
MFAPPMNICAPNADWSTDMCWTKCVLRVRAAAVLRRDCLQKCAITAQSGPADGAFWKSSCRCSLDSLRKIKRPMASPTASRVAGPCATADGANHAAATLAGASPAAAGGPAVAAAGFTPLSLAPPAASAAFFLARAAALASSAALAAFSAALAAFSAAEAALASALASRPISLLTLPPPALPPPCASLAAPPSELRPALGATAGGAASCAAARSASEL